ncbi:Hsp20/alpha crystallin family protein [Patescibacteria group bacterium]
MSSFFEKLKKEVDIEELAEESFEEKLKPSQKKKPEKLEIKIKPVESKPEKKEPKPKEKKGKEEWFESEGQLSVDFYQTEKDLIIQSAIAGIRPEDLDISIETNQVLIKGNREKPKEEEKANYFYQECYWGPFSRHIILPEEVNASKVQASIIEGILTIIIPKIKRRGKTKVTVKEK